MFQNIKNDIQEENDVNTKAKWWVKLRNILHFNDIVLYIISFMLSTVSFHSEFAPFGLAIFAAATSNKVASGFVLLAAFLRNFNKVWYRRSGNITYYGTTFNHNGSVNKANRRRK